MKKLAVHKFASCDGCQLSLLDAEEELLTLASVMKIAYFPEASSDMQPGPYDISLVEGSITTADDGKRIQDIRDQSAVLITIGACATAGGIQALRNFADVGEWVRLVYAKPQYIHSLATSTAISKHVKVDYELHGCPINKRQLVEVLTAFLKGRAPQVRLTSVCSECKAVPNTCLLVESGQPCLGPVTQAGCGALCPSYGRPCFGCYGPKENANPKSLTTTLMKAGVSGKELLRLYRFFCVDAKEFRDESVRIEQLESKHDH